MLEQEKREIDEGGRVIRGQEVQTRVRGKFRIGNRTTRASLSSFPLIPSNRATPRGRQSTSLSIGGAQGER